MTKAGLRREFLPEDTRAVFEFLTKDPALKDFTLIGGTALSLQIGHRLSEDLDFWMPNGELNKLDISMLIRRARDANFDATLTSPQDKIIAAKINGIDVLQYAQDYAFNGVKVTFFARNDAVYQYFNQFDRIRDQNVSFAVMAEDGILAMKSYVIHQRTRSRDIFDLYALQKKGHTVESILKYGQKADPCCTVENAKAVLLGVIPLDHEDEGLESVGELVPMQDIYDYFSHQINEYEMNLAKEIRKQVNAAMKTELTSAQLTELGRIANFDREDQANENDER